MKKIISTIILITFLVNFTLALNVFADNDIKVENGILQYVVNDVNSRFSVLTTTGMPHTDMDNDKNLLYFDKKPDTSFTTFKIDGQEYIFGNNYGDEGGMVSHANKDGLTTKSVWKIKDVTITQTLTLMVDLSNPNAGNMKISYLVENGGMAKVDIGSRILLDTQLGTNDASPMLVGQTTLRSERAFEGEAVPMIWSSVNSSFAPTITTFGTVHGWGNIAPNKMIVAHWQSLSNTKWDYTPDEGLNFTTDTNKYKSADSAIALYYEKTALETGKSASFETYYGVGDIIDTYEEANVNVKVAAPTKLTVNSTGDNYNESSFSVNVTIDNKRLNATDLSGVGVDVNTVDGELELAQGEVGHKVISDLAAGQSQTVSFKLKGIPQKTLKVSDIMVSVKTSDLKETETKKSIVLPSLNGEIPNVQITEITPKIMYTKAKNRQVLIKGKGLDVLKADITWNMFVQLKGGNDKTLIPRDKIIISDESLKLPLDENVTSRPGEYEIILESELYGTMSRAITLSNDKRYDVKTYSVAVIGKFGGNTYQLKNYESEAEYENDSQKDGALLTIRGEMLEYTINGITELHCGFGTIINNAIVYGKSKSGTADEMIIKRYSGNEGLQWWGDSKKSLVIKGSGNLSVGDMLFQSGDFYSVLNDDESYTLSREEGKSKVEFVTPKVKLANEAFKAVGILAGTSISISNAVIGEDTISLGGSFGFSMPWAAKAKMNETSGVKSQFDKNTSLSNTYSKEDLFYINLEELCYSLDKNNNTAQLEGFSAGGRLEISPESIPLLKTGGQLIAEVDSLNHGGNLFASLDGEFNLQDVFKATAGIELIFETGGQCIPNRIEFAVGGKFMKIPLGVPPLGYLTKLGGGINNLYSTIKKTYNKIPPVTLIFNTGYADPTTVALTIDTIKLEAGLTGVSFSGTKGAIVGLNVINNINAHFFVYETKLDGQDVLALDMGGGISINMLDIIRGEASVWFKVNTGEPSIFGNVSLGGKGYFGVFIPDRIPLVGGIELASIMAEISTYRLYAGIKVIGIPLSISYYWADKKVRFNDDFAYLADELLIPKEEFENALGFNYMETEQNADSMLLYGANLRKTYDSKEIKGMKLMGVNANNHTIPVADQDYALFEIQYTEDLPEIKVTSPDGKNYPLVTDSNYMLQTIPASESKSGIEEKRAYVSVEKPMNGDWKIQTSKAVDVVAMNVLPLPELNEVGLKTIENDKLEINWDAENVDDDYVVDVFLSQEQPELPVPVLSGNQEEYEKQMAEYNAKMAASYDTGIQVAENVPVNNKKVTVPISERLQNGSHKARVVLKKGTDTFDSKFSAQPFTYVNPHIPAKPTNVNVTPGGDAQFKVTFDKVENAQDYFITVLDDKGEKLEGFDGMLTKDNSIYIGYEVDVPDTVDIDGNILTTKKSGVIPGNNYKVSVCARNQVGSTVYLSDSYISDAITMPEPNPATIVTALNEIQTTTMEDPTGQAVGASTNRTQSVIKYIADQDVSFVISKDNVLEEKIYTAKANEPVEIPVMLEEGANVFDICTKNSGNDYTNTRVIATLDTTPPSLMFNSLNIESENQKYEITGTTEPNAHIYINDENTSVPVVDGSFTYNGTQTNTRETVKVTAVDPVGNKISQDLEIMPKELTSFKEIIITNDNGEDVDGAELNQGDSVLLHVYGVNANDLKFELDKANVEFKMIAGADIATVDSTGLLDIKNSGEAIVRCTYKISDRYQFEQTASVSINQVYQDAQDIKLSKTAVTETTPDSQVAKMYIPNATQGVSYVYSITDNEYFTVKDDTIILKKPMNTEKIEISISAQGKTMINDEWKTIGEPITKNFTMSSVKTVVSVGELNSVDAFIGDEFKALKLPQTVKVRLSDGTTRNYPVEWNQGAYNKSVSATYNLTGNLIREESVLNPLDLQAKTSVTVKKRRLSPSTSPGGSPPITVTKPNYNGENIVMEATDSNTIQLRRDLLTYETVNFELHFGDSYIILDNKTVNELKKSNTDFNYVKLIIKDNIASVEVTSDNKPIEFHGTAYIKPNQSDEFKPYNVVCTNNGEIIKYSYYDHQADKVIFRLNGVGPYAISTAENMFEDTQSHWAKDTISYLSVRNMINGIGENKFAPERPLTRAEFLKMALSATGVETMVKDNLPIDVDANEWFAPYISYALDHGIVKGYDGGNFAPNQQITREEMMVILYRLLNHLDINMSAGKIEFADKEEISSWANEAVMNLVGMNLITGNEKGLFTPLNNATRAECATVIMRIIKLLTNEI